MSAMLAQALFFACALVCGMEAVIFAVLLWFGAHPICWPLMAATALGSAFSVWNLRRIRRMVV